MRVAVISDVHANAHALDAVLAAIEGDAVDAIWNLGDTVGYGPCPNEAAAVVRERASLSLVGNHDLVALGTSDVRIEEFNPDAAAAARWTQDALDAATTEFLGRLRPEGEAAGAELYHASPFDPVWGYVLTDEAAYLSLELTQAPLVLVGHTHVALRAQRTDEGVVLELAPDGTQVDLDDGRWLLNPGSVGQPRDADPRAAYLLLDLDAGRADFRRVEYPVERTQTEIRERGLPAPLADRLAHGV
ncbi:MAG: metallophosphoesterase family protein [Thermoleophilia bacterium]|nr:metallophosphoesterase family protein [Thermoleophilia bacterium]